MPAANFDFTHRWATTTFANSIELIHAPLVNRFGMNSQLAWQLEGYSCSCSCFTSLLSSTMYLLTSWLVSSSYYWFYIHPLRCLLQFGSVPQMPLEWVGGQDMKPSQVRSAPEATDSIQIPHPEFICPCTLTFALLSTRI